MSRRSFHIEYDSHGRPKIVIGRRHGRHSPEPRTTTNEELLLSEIESLRTRLSFAESSEHRIRNQYQTLANEHYQCRNLRAQVRALENEVRRTQEKFEDEQDKVERLEERARLMRRTSHDSYRQRYAEKVVELEALQRELAGKDEWIRLEQERLDAKNRTIADRNREISQKDRTIESMRAFFRQLGYRFVDR